VCENAPMPVAFAALCFVSWTLQDPIEDYGAPRPFQSLFDGHSLSGWHGYGGEKIGPGWKAEGGVLSCRDGQGGDIATDGEYGDFELRLEWRIEPGGNSGIMYRVDESERAAWFTGPEMQVLDNAKHPDGKSPLTSAGACYAMYPCTVTTVRPADEWNAVRIVCKGNHVEHWLNGVKVVSYELGSPDWKERAHKAKFSDHPNYGKVKKGHIVLQDHGNRVEYRAIKIQELK